MGRYVICVDRNNNSTVPDRFCDANTKPPEVASCGSGPCDPNWRTGLWSKVCMFDEFYEISYDVSTVL